jgi:glycosyltransferase involved in cell wall biosynthesis
MVSIITPAFNSEKYIEEAYQSVIRQTNNAWEWIIVDDGSTDNTIDIIKGYAERHPNIYYYQRSSLPKGATTCRNIGIKKSKGSYFIFFDTDDILASFCIEQRMGEMINNPEADFIIFQMIVFNEKVDDLMVILNVPDGRDDLDRAIRMTPVMGGSSSIWKAESIKSIGLWDENLLMNQDIELYIRAMASGMKFLLRLDMPPDLFYRNNPQSISREKKRSYEKQMSRAYYFNKVAAHLEYNNLTEKYSASVKWLFLKMLFDFIYDKEFAVAKHLYENNRGIVQKLPLYYRFFIKLLLRSKYLGSLQVAFIRKLNGMFLSLKNKDYLTYSTIKYTQELRR